jgi:hypothetical protein
VDAAEAGAPPRLRVPDGAVLLVTGAGA